MLAGIARLLRRPRRDSVAELQKQLVLVQEREARLAGQIAEHAQAAKTSDGATRADALKCQQETEQKLELLQTTRIQLEKQIDLLEDALFNAATMQAMKEGAQALAQIHKSMPIPPDSLKSPCPDDDLPTYEGALARKP